MERIGPKEWQDSKDPAGTPKQANSTTTKIETVEQINQEYPSGIVINEVLPSPDGPDGEKEWIEIFNKNVFEVDLSGWKISDTIGTTKSYFFSENTKLLPKEFLVLFRPLTSIVLNNEGDELKLFSPDGKIKDSVSYEKAAIGESYARTDSSWLWSSVPTPGEINQIISLKKEILQENPTGYQKESPTTSGKGLAAIIEPIKEIKAKKDYNYFSAVLVALTISLFSGIVILMLKKKAKNLNN
jgi:hypothetical protein